MLKHLYRNTLYLLVLLVTLSCCNRAKEEADTTAEVFNRYRVERGAKIIPVPPGLVSVFLDEDQPGNTEIKEILAGVDKLTFLVIPNNAPIKESDNFSDLNQDISNLDFKDFAMVNNGKEIVKVKVSGDTVIVDELIVIVSNYKALFCISFIGEISMESIVNLTNPENIAAVSNLNRISK